MDLYTLPTKNKKNMKKLLMFEQFVNEATEKEVFVLHHTNSGSPESGEIQSIYTTEKAALAAMEKELKNNYDATMKDNRDEEYMYISSQSLY